MIAFERALVALIKAWEKLEGDKKYTPQEIQDWLINDMSPAIGNARRVLHWPMKKGKKNDQSNRDTPKRDK